ncbi:MAG: hypothetical protein K9K86_03065 [Pseudomonadales bacterium]|nr:hypothetical protein [Pseudomonadales bacterium]
MRYIEYKDEGVFKSGHFACAGCIESLSIRIIVNAVGTDAVAVVPPSCGAIICGGYPNSSLSIPTFHTTLEAAAASASGVKRSLVARGKPDTTVLCLAGDGGTYDIGFQALSSAVERNEDILYICFDNEGYMNTGGQKSSSTPLQAVTGSTPAGKLTPKKNIVEILAAHNIPYVATASAGHAEDFVRKVEKAKNIRGTKVLIVLIPCLAGWGVADNAGIKVTRLAVDSGVFPLYEVEDGVKYTLNHTKKSMPVNEYLSQQKRYKHLSEQDIAEIQSGIDKEWARLEKRTQASVD